MTDLVRRQMRREADSIEEGRKRYHEVQKGQVGASSAGGCRFICSQLERLESVIRREQIVTLERSRPLLRDPLLMAMDADKLALLTLRAILNATWTGTEDSETPVLAKVVWALVGGYASEYEFDVIRRREPKILQELMETRRTSGSRAARRDARKHAEKLKRGWARGRRGWYLAMFLIASAARRASLITLRKETTGQIRLRTKTIPKEEWVVSLKEGAERKLKEWDTACEELAPPIYLPMIVPPRPRQAARLRAGGYLTLRTNFVRHHKNQRIICGFHMAGLAQVVAGVNALQETPWKINASVWSTMEEALRRRIAVPLFPKPTRDQLSPRTFEIAGKLKDDRFYFPYFLDFRGRAYPLPQFFHPQSDDVARGLLQFADPRPLGEVGARWLAIHLANMYGYDKVSYKKRIAWVNRRDEAIRRSAEHPLKGRQLWLRAKKPWSFLAACIEWNAFCRQGSTLESHLPILVDGTCNGLQHLSALARDQRGGEETNLVPSRAPRDIYQTVCDRVNQSIHRALAKGNEEARWWCDNKVTRDTVKPATMATPYNVKIEGVRRQLTELLKKEKFGKHLSTDEQRRYADYLARHLKRAIDHIVVSAKKIRTWLTDIATILGREDRSMFWTVPSGFVVVHDYRTFKRHRITFAGCEVGLYESDPFGAIRVGKQRRAIVANFVHALDAAHMMMTINRLQTTHGLKHFFMVHDTYGVHACDMDRLHEVLRDEFAMLHKEPLLQRFLEEQRQAHPDLEPSLPDPPKPGDLKIEQVRESKYFFT